MSTSRSDELRFAWSLGRLGDRMVCSGAGNEGQGLDPHIQVNRRCSLFCNTKPTQSSPHGKRGRPEDPAKPRPSVIVPVTHSTQQAGCITAELEQQHKLPIPRPSIHLDRKPLAISCDPLDDAVIQRPGATTAHEALLCDVHGPTVRAELCRADGLALSLQPA